MAAREKESDQLLSLHDVREYLIDTNALKEAESLLITADDAKDSNRDAAYKDSKTRALGQAATKGEGRLAYMRNRAQKNKSDRKEEILNNLTGLGPQGKLNVLREEEEMKELLAVETALREESIALERERMAVAAQAESAKRSNLHGLERQMEQEMLQLELQRNNANKELDKKMSAMEELASEIQRVESEMDSQFGPEAMRDREAKKKKDAAGEGDNSKKNHMEQMFDLVKNHASAVVETRGARLEAEDEMARLAMAQNKLRGSRDAGIRGSSIDLDTIVNPSRRGGGGGQEGTKRDLNAALPPGLLQQKQQGQEQAEPVSEAVQKASDLLSSMGTYPVLLSFFLPSFVSASLSRSIAACLPAFSTPHDTSLTIIPPSPPRSIVNRHNTHITFYNTGTTLGLEGQQARLAALRLQAQNDDEFDVDTMLGDNNSSMGNNNNNGDDDDDDDDDGRGGSSLTNHGKSLHDSLDAWLGADDDGYDGSGTGDSSSGGGRAAVPSAESKPTAYTNNNQQQQQQQQQQGAPARGNIDASSAPKRGMYSESSSSSSGEAKLSREPSSYRQQQQRGGMSRSNIESVASFTADLEGSSSSHAGGDSLTTELMNEIKRLRADKDEREKRMQEEQKQQQAHFQQQIQHLQAQMQHQMHPGAGPGGMGVPPVSSGYGGPDPYMMQFMQQMNAQMDKENQLMMQQMQGGYNQGGNDPYGNNNQYGGNNPYNPNNQRINNNNQDYDNNGNNPNNPLRRSGGYALADSGLQGFHDRAARDGKVDRELHIPLHRKQLHKVEVKYSEDLRLLSLEMERVQRQTELDDYVYVFCYIHCRPLFFHFACL
jgi:hypothetical protein